MSFSTDSASLPAMPSIAFVLPLLPGKTDDDRDAMTSCGEGSRRNAFAASRLRHGISREAVWIQHTPAGDIALVYLEADDLAEAFSGVATSDEPFDRWFREHVRDVHGIALEDGLTPSEQILDFHSPVAAPSR
jgi:hypothetical protein